jgi:hypothetical protein
MLLLASYSYKVDYTGSDTARQGRARFSGRPHARLPQPNEIIVGKIESWRLRELILSLRAMAERSSQENTNERHLEHTDGHTR